MNMRKTFRPYSLNQRLLLPPDLREWVPEDHLALCVSDGVDARDLSAIVSVYKQGDGRGHARRQRSLAIHFPDKLLGGKYAL